MGIIVDDLRITIGKFSSIIDLTDECRIELIVLNNISFTLPHAVHLQKRYLEMSESVLSLLQ